MSKKQPRLYEVVWEDSTSWKGWDDPSYASEAPLICRSVGWVLRRDRNKLVMAATTCENDTWNQRHTIPMGCVKRIRRVGVTPKANKRHKG